MTQTAAEFECERLFDEMDRRIENSPDQAFAFRMRVYKRVLEVRLRRIGAEQFASEINATLEEMGLTE